MLDSYLRPTQTVVLTPCEERLEISRLLAAATVSPVFAELLLDDPETALQQGYEGENFLLTQEERDLILSIRADSLPQLAMILVRTLYNWERTCVSYPAQVKEYSYR